MIGDHVYLTTYEAGTILMLLDENEKRFINMNLSDMLANLRTKLKKAKRLTK